MVNSCNQIGSINLHEKLIESAFKLHNNSCSPAPGHLAELAAFGLQLLPLAAAPPGDLPGRCRDSSWDRLSEMNSCIKLKTEPQSIAQIVFRVYINALITWSYKYLLLQRGLGFPVLLLQVVFHFFCFQKLLLQTAVLALSFLHTSFDGWACLLCYLSTQRFADVKIFFMATF